MIEGPHPAVLDFFARLVDAYPADEPVWRTMSRTFTGAELAQEIRVGSEYGRAYVKAFSEAMRDALARQAKRHAMGNFA